MNLYRINQDKRSLDTFGWYKSLYEYSRPQSSADGNEDEEPELGPDGDLVSAMISTAIIPRFCKLIEGGVFDPYSAEHVRTLVDVAEQIEASVQRDDLKFQVRVCFSVFAASIVLIWRFLTQMLLKSVFAIFQRAAESTESTLVPYMASNNPRFDPEAIPARRRYLARCTKLLSNVIRWRKYSGERFGIGILLTTLSTNCMLPVAESGWEVGGEQSIREVNVSPLFMLCLHLLHLISGC